MYSQGLTLTFDTTFHFGEYRRFQDLRFTSNFHFVKWITVLQSYVKWLTAETKMFLGTVSVLFDIIIIIIETPLQYFNDK